MQDQPSPEVVARVRERLKDAKPPIVCFAGKATPFNPDAPENYPEWQGFLSPPPPSQEEIDRMAE